jgi:hydrogenase maturation protease
MPRVLIVAYGNPLRSDDGVAWRAADALEGKLPDSEVEILEMHQLAPELAENLSRVEAVIFVDAAEKGEPGEIHCEELSPTGEAPFAHQLSPGAVLLFARQVYDRSPRAFSVTLTGECFDHGEALSPAVVAALPGLVARIEALAQQLLSR